MERLFATLEIRSFDDEKREFSGIANTAAEDDHKTIVEPQGARFTLPMPFLFSHDEKSPVGEVTAAKLVGDGWQVKGRVIKIEEDGFVRELTDRAWHNIKYKLMRGLSIGFIPIKKKGNRFVEWMWKELSLVTLPSNTEATIFAVRSAYIADKSPGDSGTSTKNPSRKMTNQERITAFENTRAAKSARKQALLDAAAERGETMNEAEAEEFDTLGTEIRSIDKDLVRLNEQQTENEKKPLTPVVARNGKEGSETRGGIPIVKVRANTEPGITFARYVMSLVACDGVRSEAAIYAREKWGDAGEEIAVQHRSAMMHRAAVAPGTTVQATFAAPLVQTTFMDEMLELLRAATLVERIPGLRRVPFNISMPAQTAGGTYKWVGEGKLKPVTNAQFAAVTLGRFKASGIIVLTEELVRSSAPSAELVVRNELRDGIVRFLDLQFIDPAIAAVAATNPASITNGVAGTAASGTTEAAARADLRALIKTFVTNNIGLDGVVLLMNQAIAFGLGTIMNAVGTPAFPGITAAGGNLLGIPVVTSNTITAAVGIVAVHAPSVLLADEGGIEIDVSREASLSLDSAPTEPADATAVYTSLWQANLVGLRVERFISWGKARSTAVDRIHTVAYA